MAEPCRRGCGFQRRDSRVIGLELVFMYWIVQYVEPIKESENDSSVRRTLWLEEYAQNLGNELLFGCCVWCAFRFDRSARRRPEPPRG